MLDHDRFSSLPVDGTGRPETVTRSPSEIGSIAQVARPAPASVAVIGRSDSASPISRTRVVTGGKNPFNDPA